MPAAELKDINNKVKGSVNLPEELFGLSARKDILHESVKNFLANQRQGTHATKTKGLVSGGGKKPWKQKHTGRARAGSIRSPLWRGGGTIFGPQPRDYSYVLPKNIKRRALGEALSAKLSSGELTIIDAISVAKPSTKEMVHILKSLGLEGKSVLVVLPEREENVMLSARNIPGVNVARVMDLNAYDVMRHSTLLITKGALDLMTSAVPEKGSEL
jgi:large subunit ribosomal protein L4